MADVVEHLYNRECQGKIVIDDTLKAAIDAYYGQYGAKIKMEAVRPAVRYAEDSWHVRGGTACRILNKECPIWRKYIKQCAMQALSTL